jgi:phosphatidylglycerol lysyltransferase
MTAVPLDVRVALLRQHGSASQSYSAAFQPGLEHFGDERGFLAYKTVWGTAMVISDPIGPPDSIGDLISRFLKDHPDCSFWNASRRTAEALAPLGFFINEMGPDTWIDLTTYDFKGTKKVNLRNATNRMAKAGFVTRESSLAEVGLDEVKRVSEDWRRTRQNRNREVAFLNRPLVLAEEPDVRRFFTFDRHGKLVAFGFFDPVYDGGAVIGYMSQHNRHVPQADSAVHLAIKRHAIETFQKEGRKRLSLGLSPLAYIQDLDFPQQKNWLVRRAFRFAYTNRLFNRFFYPLQGIEAHKRLYRGVPEQTYCAFNKLPSLPRILKLLVACKIV